MAGPNSLTRLHPHPPGAAALAADAHDAPHRVARIYPSKLLFEIGRILSCICRVPRKLVSRHLPIRAAHEGWPRAICDYLAGMTDRYALQEHQRLFGLQP